MNKRHGPSRGFGGTSSEMPTQMNLDAGTRSPGARSGIPREWDTARGFVRTPDPEMSAMDAYRLGFQTRQKLGGGKFNMYDHYTRLNRATLKRHWETGWKTAAKAFRVKRVRPAPPAPTPPTQWCRQ